MNNLKFFFTAVLVVISIIITGCSNGESAEKENKKEETKEVEKSPTQKEKDKNVEFKIIKAKAQKLEHIHGIGYPGNDKGLYVASHNGIKIYSNNEWKETTSERHDYMGFQAVKEGFIASGHPEKGSSLKDPLGLVQSTDKGQSLNKLAFYGESDFHFLAASFSDKVFYVINEHQNSKLKPGVFYTDNEGASWEKVELNGFESDTLGMIAVHPSKGNIMAMSTRDGIYYSENNGMDIKKVSDSVITTAVTFMKNELLYSSVEEQKILFKKLNLKTLKSEKVLIPNLKYENPITYIAVDPNNEKRISFVTYENDIFESTTGGESWKEISAGGSIQ